MLELVYDRKLWSFQLPRKSLVLFRRERYNFEGG